MDSHVLFICKTGISSWDAAHSVESSLLWCQADQVISLFEPWFLLPTLSVAVAVGASERETLSVGWDTAGLDSTGCHYRCYNQRGAFPEGPARVLISVHTTAAVQGERQKGGRKRKQSGPTVKTNPPVVSDPAQGCSAAEIHVP